MHRSGLLPLTFESLEQGFEGKNCQNGNQGKPCSDFSSCLFAQSSKVRFLIASCNKTNRSDPALLFAGNIYVA